MDKGRMITIAFILKNEFPVGLDAMLQEAGSDFDFTLGRGANQTVNGLGCAAQMLFQSWTFSSERAKHEAVIRLHARYAAQSEFCFVAALISVRKGITDEAAVVGEGPRVERT